MRILVLEDSIERIKYFLERFCDHDLTITENAESAINYLAEGVYDCIFLDHDLGKNNGSGADVAAFLASGLTENFHSTIIIHSWNMPAVRAIKDLLPKVYVLPFGSTDFYELELCNRGS